MKLGTTDISILSVRNILGYPSTDLGTLCSCGENYINIWSPYKPINYNGLTLSDTIRNKLTGFKIVNNYLQYDPPVGGSTSPYRLGDFRGYKSDAAKPSNVTEKQDIFVKTTADIPDYRTFAFNYYIPEYDTVAKMAIDPNLYLDTICLTDSSGVVQQGTIYGVSTGGLCQAKISDLGLSANNRAVRFSISRIDVSKYGATNIGNTFTIPLTVWLGSSKSGASKVAKIPGGDSIKITGQIKSSGVITYITAYGDDFDCPVLGAADSEVQGTFNQGAGTYTVTYIRWGGQVRNMATTDAAFKFNRPQDYTVYKLQYSVYRNGSLVSQVNDILGLGAIYKNSVVSEMRLDTYTYKVILNQPFTISGVQTGDEIRFVLNNNIS